MLTVTPSLQPANKLLQFHCVVFNNARSVRNKAVSIADFVMSQDIDILALTETWLGRDTDKTVLRELVPTGYNILHVPRTDGRRGGGVAFLYISGLSPKNH